MTEMPDDREDVGLNECAHCEGMFVPDDMEGDHCRQCTAELFGDD